MGRPKQFDKTAIRSLLESGYTRKQVSELIGCSVPTVDAVKGVKARRPKVDYTKIEECLRSGMARNAVAKKLGYSLSTITKCAKSLGIDNRKNRNTKVSNIINLAKTGLNVNQIAVETNLSSSYIKLVCKQNKITFKLIAEDGWNSYILPENVLSSYKKDELILELREQGLTYKEIDHNFSICENTILRCLRRNGLSTPRKERAKN